MNDEEFYQKAINEWLTQAGEVICGCSVPGEWSGDDWYLSDKVEFRVRGRKTLGKTADAIVAKAHKVLAPLEKELRLADEILTNLADGQTARVTPSPMGNQESDQSDTTSPIRRAFLTKRISTGRHATRRANERTPGTASDGETVVQL